MLIKFTVAMRLSIPTFFINRGEVACNKRNGEVTSRESVRCESRENLKKKKKAKTAAKKGKVEEWRRRHRVICGKQIIVRAANHSARWPTSEG